MQDTEELKEFRIYLQDLYAARRDARWEKKSATNSIDWEAASQDLINCEILIKKAKRNYKKLLSESSKIEKEVVTW